MKYYEITPEENYFDTLFTDVTHRCNMNCANCYIPNRSIPDMDKIKLYSFIKRLPKKVFIRLIGAEPTVRTDLPEIIYTIIKLGHKPILVTNGLKLAKESYCVKLRKAGLKYLAISMNGAADDNIYIQMDGGKYASLKVKALINSFKVGFFNINTGTIVARGINEKTVKEQVDLIIYCAKQAGIKKLTKRLQPVLRIKTPAPIGRSMNVSHSYAFNELLEVVSQQLNVNIDFIKSHPVYTGSNKINICLEDRKNYKSYAFHHKTELGNIYIRLIDWTVDKEGVPDPGNKKRGRITQNWKIAPAFEHIKKNEGAY